MCLTSCQRVVWGARMPKRDMGTPSRFLNNAFIGPGLYLFSREESGTIGHLLWDWRQSSLRQVHEPRGFWCSEAGFLRQLSASKWDRQAPKGADYCAQDFTIERENHWGGELSPRKTYLPHVISMEGESEVVYLLFSCFLNKVYSLTHAFGRSPRSIC